MMSTSLLLNSLYATPNT